MGLVLKTKVTQSQDGTQAFIEVVNATGTYDSVNNPGGFGSPNPARNTLALIFYGNFNRVAADVLAAPLPNDPTTVSLFTLNIVGLNGVLDYNVLAIPIFNPSGTYANGDVVYDNQNVNAPFIKKMVSSAWVPITVIQALSETIVVQKNGFAFLVPEMSAYRNGLNSNRLVQLQAKIDEGDDNDWSDYYLLRDGFDFVDGMLDAAAKDFCATAYAPAQVKLEKIEAYSKSHPLTP